MKSNYKLKRLYMAPVKFIITVLLWIFMICPCISSAQAQQTYHCFSYYKGMPGEERELRRMMETVDAKVQQNRVNNGAISSWYIYDLLAPTGSSAEYDYVMITTTNSLENTFEPSYTFDSAFKKTFPGKDAKFFSDYYSRQTEAWRLVKQEIYVGLGFADSTFPAGLQLKYIAVDFMQPIPAKAAQYMKSEMDTFRLIHRERAKLGAISQWGFLQLVSPYDTKMTYGNLALNYYKELNKIFDFNGSKYVEALKAAFPTVDLGNLFNSAVSLRDNPKAEILRLLFYALPVKR